MKDRLRIGAERLGFTESEIAELLRVYVTVRATMDNKAKELMIDGRFTVRSDGPREGLDQVVPTERVRQDDRRATRGRWLWQPTKQVDCDLLGRAPIAAPSLLREDRELIANHRGILIALAGLVAIGAAVVLLLLPAQEAGVLFAPDDRSVVATGRVVYAEQCAACHGADLEGQPNWRQPGPDGKLPAPPHDETGHTWHHPDELLFAITKYGTARAAGLDDYQSDMPTYEAILSDDEIVAVLSFVKSTWPDAVRERHDALNAQ